MYAGLGGRSFESVEKAIEDATTWIKYPMNEWVTVKTIEKDH